MAAPRADRAGAAGPPPPPPPPAGAPRGGPRAPPPPRLNYADRLMRCEAAGDHLARCARTEPQVHAEVLTTLRALVAASGPLATAELQDRGISSTPAHSTSSTSSRSAITAASAEQPGQRSTQAAPS